MEDQSKTEYGLLNLKAGNIFSNIYSSHLPNFRSDFSAFQNWRDCFKRNSEEFHRALEDLNTGELWDAKIPHGKSQNNDILPGNLPKCDKRSIQGLHSPSSVGQCLPAFAPVFAGLMNRRRRRENRPRRQRTTFSSDQTVKLEIEYSRTEYITRSRRYELAELLCLTENQIKIWFQNRRAKEKRIEKAHMDHHLRTLSITGHAGSFPIPKCPNGDLGEASSWPESPPIPKPKHT